jgi:polysaccharide biosynthesis protein PslH
MRCLWLTLADPDPPTNGQYLYSGGLIKALASAGGEVHVVALARPDGRRHHGLHERNIRWSLGGHRPGSKYRSLFSSMPIHVARTSTPAMRRLLRGKLAGLHWDAVIFDSITPGWALRSVARHCSAAGDNAPVVGYVAHNHEGRLSAEVAKIESRWLKRWMRQLDAAKMRRVERMLIRHASFVTAISLEDCSLFDAEWPDKSIIALSPGYGGQYVAERRIGVEMPRRAVILGSFDWSAKRANLREFLRAAVPLFETAAVELQVVGNAETQFLDKLRGEFPTVDFTGRVDDIAPYLCQARVAIATERIGGGFKLKVLDYVFHRVPIVALDGSITGVPLHEGENIRLCSDERSLARTVIQIIDDVETLNRMQDSAYRACRPMFDWAGRGQQLLRQLHRSVLDSRQAGVRARRTAATGGTAHEMFDSQARG